MQIIVTDRMTIEAGLPVPAGSYVVISVRDPGKPPANIPRTTALRDVLDLAFHDTEPQAGFAPYNELVPMTEDHARQIAQFVLRYHSQVDAIVIHCEQGMSRSPAIAAAVAQSLNLDTTPYDRGYQPNAYVRDLLTEAFQSANRQRRR